MEINKLARFLSGGAQTLIYQGKEELYNFSFQQFQKGGCNLVTSRMEVYYD